LPDVERKRFLRERGEAGLRDGQRVARGRQLEKDEAPIVVSDERLRRVGLNVLHLDGCAGHERAASIRDYALYDAGRDLRLRVCADKEAEPESKAGDPQRGGHKGMMTHTLLLLTE